MKRETINLHFGASTPRIEDPRLLTGQGCFVDDMHPERMLHAFVLRSPHAHALIRSVDASEARSAPGVALVLSCQDLPQVLRDRPLPAVIFNPAVRHPLTQHVLAKDEVCYVGEPVAVVVARERSLAEDAATLIEVDYETLPAVASLAQAVEPGGPIAHRDLDSNVIAEVPFIDGDCDAAFASAHKVVSARFELHRGGGFFMETRGCLAMPGGPMAPMTLYGTLQSPHRIKRILLEMFGFADDQLRVVAPSDVGGGFGPKGSMYPEYPMILHCAMALGRPVKWIEDRRENFLATHQERDQIWDLELALDDQARILGLRGDLLHDNGAYVPWALVLPWISMTTVQGPYVIPAFSLMLRSVFTNKVSTTPVRGAGRPQAVFSMERLMDFAAQAFDLPPEEVRRRNFIQPGQMPFNCRMIGRDGRPVIYDSGDYPNTLALALSRSGHGDFRQRQQLLRGQGRYVGIGLANFVEGTGLGPYEGATIRISTNGSIVLYTGAAPQGQSHQTVFAQIAADPLGVAPHQIRVVTGDTHGISLGIGTFAARSAVNAGNAVYLAATSLRRKVQETAARIWGIEADAIELSEGAARMITDPARRLSFAELAVQSVGMPGYSLSAGTSPGLEQTSYFSPTQSTYSNGCHVVEAEVDIGTGAVKLLRYVVVDDCGRQINPMVVHGQVAGGIAHGLGNALLERILHDETGQPVSTHFGEYLLPLASDVPDFEIHHTETPSPLNPLGVKGAGEGGTVPAMAAIVSAIEDALRPFGVRICEVPITPVRIVEMLRARESGPSPAS